MSERKTVSHVINGGDIDTEERSAADDTLASGAAQMTTSALGLPRVTIPKRNIWKEPTLFTNACAALNIKPNSKVLAMENDVLTSATVNLAGNYLGGKCFTAVVQLLTLNQNVTKLVASGNGLTNESVVVFARSMRDHPTLATVDFSNNPALSLPAATAISSLLQVNRIITAIDLSGTEIEESLVRKITRTLNLRNANSAATSDKRAAMTDALTPYQRAVATQPTKAADKRREIRKEKVAVEQDRQSMCRSHIRDTLRGYFANTQAYLSGAAFPRSNSGWVVVNISVSCAPNAFNSELDIIYHETIPRLNKQLEEAKIHLNPVAMLNDVDPHRFDVRGDKNASKRAVNSLYGGGTSDPTKKDPKTGIDRQSLKQLMQNYAVGIDFETNIRQSSPFHIHLLGEKVGLAEQPEVFPRKQGSGSETVKGKYTYRAVQYKEYEVGKSMPVSILMHRTPTAAMKVPAAFLPLLTDDPRIVCPDEHSKLISEKVAAARGEAPSALLGYFDINAEKAKWEEFMAFKKKAVLEHPGTCLVCEDYHAVFESVDPQGNVRLSGLSAETASNEGHEDIPSINFSRALEARLRAGIECVFPEAAYLLERDEKAALGAATSNRGIGGKNASGGAIVQTSEGSQMEAFLAALDGRRVGSSFDDGIAQSRVRNYINSAIITIQKKAPGNGVKSQQLGGGDVDDDDLVDPAEVSYGAHVPTTVTQGRRNVMGKLELYAVTPPSRNMTLLYASPSSGTSSTLRSFLSRIYKKGNFIVAHHFAREVSLYGEPTDMRCMFLNLIKQLDPSLTSTPAVGANPRLPTYMLNEYQINKVQDLFTGTLARVAASAPDNAIILIVIDGLDDVDVPVYPCDSLRLSETGLDLWDPAGSSRPQSSSEGGLTTTGNRVPSQLRDTFSYIPICLPKNVRIVASCQTSSDTHKVLERRGHDSCDPVAVGELTEQEAEQLLLSRLHEIPGVFVGSESDKPSPDCIAVTEKVIATILANEATREGGFIPFVVESIRGLRQCPFAAGYGTSLSASGVLPLQSLVDNLPKSTHDACEQLLDQVERLCGLSFAKKAISLLLTSRWGLLDVELSALLARNDKSSQSRQNLRKEYIPGDQLLRLIRLLRPVLKSDPSDVICRAAAVASGLELNATPINVSGLERVRFIEHREFRDASTKRYLQQPDAQISTHQMLAHFYHSQFLVPSGVFQLGSTAKHPLMAKAVKECAFHVVMGRMWNSLQDWVANLSFLCCAFELGLGYQTLRELVRGYNQLHDAAEAGMSASEKQVALERLKEYVYFTKNHSINLVQFPHMAHQIAITNPSGTFLHRDAEAHFRATDNRQPHFRASAKSQTKTHQDAVTGCCFAPSGMRFATCSDDRVLKIFTVSGDLVHSISLSASRLKRVIYSATSRYVLTMAEDRTIFVYDASSSNLVCKFHGHNSPIHGLAFSCRGRFIATGSEDRSMKLWDTETGRILVAVPHSAFTHASSVTGGVNVIVPHSTNEYEFIVACDKKIVGWRLNMARDNCEQTLCINSHNTLPLGSLHVVRSDSIVIGVCGGDVGSVTPVAHAEASIKAWSIATGVCIMHFATPGPMARSFTPVRGVVSPDERLLAVSFSDGSVVIYHPPYHQANELAETGGETQPIQVPILAHFSAFVDHPVSRVTDICFSHDSSMVAIVGNLRQLKVYAIPSSSEDCPPMQQPTVSEYLLEYPMTCVAWNENPQENSPEIILGDSTGRVHSLHLVR